jgi:signal transduction histidine kinase
MTSLPIVFGIPYLAQEISILPTVIYPLSFAFAVTRYRLMEIDNILDTAVIYGFTILVLAGIETTFLSYASPYLLTAGKGLPALSVLAVLLIVFIYVPIRNVVKGLVERLFKRGKYDPEKELQQFMVRLGLCDERSALEKFTAFVKDLLRPSGIVVLKIGDRTASILHASNDLSRQEGEKIVSRTGKVWEHVRNKGTCAFGYELSEKIGHDGVPFTPDLESALFVPFITDQGDTTSGYLAVLLKKWNETAYSVKDVMLLNAISVNIANIIEAGELRNERVASEERFRKEKDAVMKELHDGLGNILTSVTVTSQAAERVTGGAEQRVKRLIGRIGEFSAEATDFLRTGLTVLDNPREGIGAVMESIKDRFGDLLESSGIELKIECAEDAKRLRPGAVVIMNLVRIIQEALSNILKHSSARRARIGVVRSKDGLGVMVTDDGKGFDAGEKKAGYGLTNMRRRVEEMTGDMKITSSRENGTKIGFTIPFADSAGKAEVMYAAGDR